MLHEDRDYMKLNYLTLTKEDKIWRENGKKECKRLGISRCEKKEDTLYDRIAGEDLKEKKTFLRIFMKIGTWREQGVAS